MRDQGTRDDIGPDGLTDQQRAAGYAPRKHSVEHGRRRQPDLATPLSEAELATCGGYGPAITDVDPTPRPRYGESRAAFLRRMTGYGADIEALKREMRAKNRASALRSTEIATHEGGQRLTYWTQCACGWCGLRVDDPEVARREYDAHACAADGLGDAAVDRAQAHAGKATMPAKRTAAVLRPALEQQVSEEPALVPSRQDLQDLDDATPRYALLELERR